MDRCSNSPTAPGEGAGATTETADDGRHGWMEWTIIPGTAEQRMDHPAELRPITVRVPRGVPAMTAVRIMDRACDLMELLNEAWGVEGTLMMRVRTFDGDGTEIERKEE